MRVAGTNLGSIAGARVLNSPSQQARRDDRRIHSSHVPHRSSHHSSPRGRSQVSARDLLNI